MFPLISMLSDILQQELTLSFIMLKNGQTYFENLTVAKHILKILRCEHRKILKYVWPFFNIMKV